MARPPRLRVAVAGATGLIGQALLALLRTDPAVGGVQALVRPNRKTAAALPEGVQPLPVDYARLGQPGSAGLPPLDWALCALGTTIAVAGSRAAFRAVDVDAVVAFARAARQAGASRFAVVSALGADARSAVFYNRCKGEMEAALREIGFERLVIARPSLLLGDREALGQPARPGETLARRLTPALSWLLPRRVRPIDAATVARALLHAIAADEPGIVVLESDALQRLGAARGPVS
jgi:uncharacterized protein YbjT (DUF2867 family)